MEYCVHFNSVHIIYDVYTEKIKIYRCCLKQDDIIKEYSITEWCDIPNIIEELNKFVDVWVGNKKS